MPVIDLRHYTNVIKELLAHTSEVEYRLEYNKYMKEGRTGEASILKSVWNELNGHKVPALLK